MDDQNEDKLNIRPDAEKESAKDVAAFIAARNDSAEDTRAYFAARRAANKTKEKGLNEKEG